jgi:hypothetical protein
MGQKNSHPFSTLKKSTIQVFIHRPSFSDSKFLIEIPSSATVADLKQKIQDLTGMPIQEQSLSWKEVPLDNEKPLSSYTFLTKPNIQEWSFHST